MLSIELHGIYHGVYQPRHTTPTTVIDNLLCKSYPLISLHQEQGLIEIDDMMMTGTPGSKWYDQF